MADEETFDELEARELETLDIALLAKIERTAVTLEEFVQTSLAQGVDPDDLRRLLLQDLEEGGRIFGEFRRAIRSTAVGSLNKMRDAGQYAEFGVERAYRWSAILVNTCRASAGLDGCIDRHGIVRTWDEWESFGLPRTGRTTCQTNCRCVLLPAESTELEPIKREKKK